MMTLSGLAGISPAPRPSGETLVDQRNRIFAAIGTLLGSGSLATGAGWSCHWLGLTQDRANLAYLVVNPAARATALVLRGTIVGSPIDTTEDLDVGTLLPFADGGGGKISQGAMTAFTEIVNITDPTTGISLTGAITAQLLHYGNLTLYVTGHSLGGAMATTVGLFLDKHPWPQQPPVAIHVYTFAAPTSGDADFAARFNKVFPKLGTIPARGYVGTWNQYDVVPNAWWNLVKAQGPSPAEEFFPLPGPVTTLPQRLLVEQMYDKTNGNKYVQPTLALALNKDFKVNFPTHGNNSIGCWEAEVGFQHANNTYLSLILNDTGQSAPPIPALAPVVTGLSPAQGPYGGTQVTINGSNFTSDCQADFGVVSAVTTYVSPVKLLAVAPRGVGIVNVTVTNSFGTSATSVSTACYDTPPYNPSAFCQFTYQPPT